MLTEKLNETNAWLSDHIAHRASSSAKHATGSFIVGMMCSLAVDALAFTEVSFIAQDDDAAILDLSFSLNGDVLALASSSAVELYQTESRELIGSIETSGYSGDSDSFILLQPHGSLIAVNETDRSTLYRLPHLGIVGVLQSDMGAVDAVAFSPDGRLLARKLADQIDLWDVNSLAKVDSWAVIPSELLSPHYEDSVRTSNDSVLVDRRMVPLRWLAGKRGWRTAKRRTLTFSPDGRLIASVHEQSIHLWDAETGEEARIIADSVPFGSIRFSAIGRYLAATVPSGGQVYAWDITRDQTLGHQLEGRLVFEPHRVGAWNGRDFSFSPDGRLIALPRSHQVLILDIGTGSFRFIADPKPPGERPDFHAVAISNDGRLLAAGDWNGNVHVWDVATLARLGVLGQHNGPVGRIEFSPSGRLLASTSENGSLLCWEIDGESLASVVESSPVFLATEGLWIPFELKEAAEVTATIRVSFFGLTVRTIAVDHQAAMSILSRPRHIYWDGKDSDGQPVPLTDYNCTITNGSYKQSHTIRHENGLLRIR